MENRRRASRACVNCHISKLRCVYSTQNNTCDRCSKQQLPCQERIRKRRKTTDSPRDPTPADRPEVQVGSQSAQNNTNSTKASLRHSLAPQLSHTEAPEQPRGPLEADSPDIATASSVDSLKENIVTSHNALELLGNRRFNAHVDAESNNEHTVTDAAIVRDGILIPEMVLLLVDFFFAEIACFAMPSIPEEYRTSKLYAEDFLLAVICTLGARHKEDDSFTKVHRKLWSYCENFLREELWQCQSMTSGSNCSRTRSVIFGLLLLSEWIPGAYFLDKKDASPVDFASDYRAKSWLYVGHALRLAQYSGLLEKDKKVFFEIHKLETFLVCRMDGIAQLSGLFDEETFSDVIDKFNPDEKAVHGLLNLFCLANKTVYKSSSFALDLCRTGAYITKLRLLWNLAKKWESEYRELLLSDGPDTKKIKFEFDYCMLYILSISITPYSTATTEDFLHLEESEMFLDRAIEAARSVVKYVTELSPVNNTPLRWTLRLIHAVIFLAKGLLSEPEKFSSKENNDIFGKIKEYGHVLDRFSVPRFERYSKLLGSFFSRIPTCQKQLDLNQQQNSVNGGHADSLRETRGVGHALSPLHAPSPLPVGDLFTDEMVDFFDVFLGPMPLISNSRDH